MSQGLNDLYQNIKNLQSLGLKYEDGNPFIDIIGAFEVFASGDEILEEDIQSVRDYADFRPKKPGFLLLLTTIKKNPKADIASLIATILLFKEFCELKYQNSEDQAKIVKLIELCQKLRKKIEPSDKDADKKTKKLAELVKNIDRVESISTAPGQELLAPMFPILKSEQKLKCATSALLKKEGLQDLSNADSLKKIESLIEKENHLYNQAIGDSRIEKKTKGGFINGCKYVISLPFKLLFYLAIAAIITVVVACLIVVALVALAVASLNFVYKKLAPEEEEVVVLGANIGELSVQEIAPKESPELIV